MNFGAVARIGKRVSAFLGGQSAVQLLNAATGLALLRLLPKPEFAIYSVALAVQSTINQLTDVGFGTSIIGLVGTRYHDKKLLGTYVKAAGSVRQILMLIVSVIAVACVVVFRRTQFAGHGLAELTFLAVTMLITVQFQAWASYYEVPLLLNNRLKSFYGPQIAAAALRMAAFLALYYAHYISSTSVIVANTASIVVMGLSFRYLTRPWIEVPTELPREQVREMIRYLVPLLPIYIYSALSGQISLFLISVFGHVSQVADVAAAGRIGQLFLLLGTSNSVLLAPFIAKTPQQFFRRRYAFAMSAVGFVALIVAASAKYFPCLYLLVLGPRYRDLTQQVQLVVYTAATLYVCGAMWAVVTARKWVFWWSGTAQVIVTILILIASIVFLPLNTSVGILKMGLYTSLGSLGVQIVYLITALSKESKAQAAEAAIAS